MKSKLKIYFNNGNAPIIKDNPNSNSVDEVVEMLSTTNDWELIEKVIYVDGDGDVSAYPEEVNDKLILNEFYQRTVNFMKFMKAITSSPEYFSFKNDITDYPMSRPSTPHVDIDKIRAWINGYYANINREFPFIDTEFIFNVKPENNTFSENLTKFLAEKNEIIKLWAELYDLLPSTLLDYLSDDYPFELSFTEIRFDIWIDNIRELSQNKIEDAVVNYRTNFVRLYVEDFTEVSHSYLNINNISEASEYMNVSGELDENGFQTNYDECYVIDLTTLETLNSEINGNTISGMFADIDNQDVLNYMFEFIVDSDFNPIIPGVTEPLITPKVIPAEVWTEKTLEFYECEHDGDLQNYIGDIESCSDVTVIDSFCNDEEETGVVYIKYLKGGKFHDEFRETDAFEFLN